MLITATTPCLLCPNQSKAPGAPKPTGIGIGFDFTYSYHTPSPNIPPVPESHIKTFPLLLQANVLIRLCVANRFIRRRYF